MVPAGEAIHHELRRVAAEETDQSAEAVCRGK
jgi:hypothetical protein